ncbi:MAG TPA: pantetheine-phosphate adenylyltransferase [Ktedonobacteraceae bacterium]|nr:pantetheine-phosphate adenylyltransferase [Ktedonobacteraceae bacterium]
MSKEEQRSRLAVYPGSFDPPTNGHLDIAKRAARLFETLVIAIFVAPAKNLLFTTEEREALWQEVIADEGLKNVQVASFRGLTVDYLRARGADVIIKGLRTGNDFEAERQQGLMNAQMAPEIETVCLFSNKDHLYISSSLTKEIARLGGNVDDMLPAAVVSALQRKFAATSE